MENIYVHFDGMVYQTNSGDSYGRNLCLYFYERDFM